MNCKYLYGATESNLVDIRSWDYGVLLIKPSECRGVDTRFAKDALVLIAAKVESYHQYLQMLGRSSRSRKVCEGILYSVTSERPSQVIERLKRANVSLM